MLSYVFLLLDWNSVSFITATSFFNVLIVSLKMML